jgi:hypothetical protein
LEAWDYRVARAEALTSSPLGLTNPRLSLSGPMDSPYALFVFQTVELNGRIVPVFLSW